MAETMILVVEDIPQHAEQICQWAREAGFTRVDCAASPAEALSRLKERGGYDVLSVDLKLGPTDLKAGITFLRHASLARPVRIIIYSGHPEVEMPGDLADRVARFEKPREADDFRRELKRCVDKLSELWTERFLAVSESDLERQRLIPWIARTDLPVIITGPSASGKEFLAWSMAKWSAASGAEVRAVNCATLTGALLMCELFGHVKGAFTNADRHRVGLLLEASGYKGSGRAGGFLDWLKEGGTHLEKSTTKHGEHCHRLPSGTARGVLILDEVTQLTMEAQAALLRALDGHPLKPVGYDGPGFLPNARIISVTNDVERLHDEERFRGDLRNRLEGWRVEVESITERPETAKAIVKEYIGNAAFWDERGQEVRPPFGIDKDGMSEFLKDPRNLEAGGIRGLICWVKRACTYAYIDGIDPDERKYIVRRTHVEQARANTVPLPPSTPRGIEWLVQQGIIAQDTKEYHILQFLLRQPGVTVAAEALVRFIDESEELREVRERQKWPKYESVRALRMAISRLRKKFRDKDIPRQFGWKLMDRGIGLIQTGQTGPAEA